MTGIGPEDFAVTYDMNPDDAIKLARTDYVFFGTSLEEIEKKYLIPKELLGELAFVGKDSWRELRAKVEEDELDGLINTNLYVLKKSLHAAITKVQGFLEANNDLEDWDEVQAVMKVIGGLTKAAEVSKKLQDHRLPNKINKTVKRGEMPLLLSEEMEEEEEKALFEDEFSKGPRQKQTVVETEEELADALDNLI